MINLRVLGTIDLRDGEGREVVAVLAQPKRLALLAYLATPAPAGHHRRDTLLGLFWPDLDNEHARNALSKAIHFLREALGADVIVSRNTEELALDPARIWIDVRRFDEAVAEGRHEEALGLYRGDLLPALFVSDSAPFEHWLEEARHRLRARAIRAARVEAERHEREHNHTAAIDVARRGAELSHDDERTLRRLLQLLWRLGDRAGALALYERFARRLAEDLDAAPSAETSALIEQIRTALPPAIPTASPLPSPPDAADPATRLQIALGERYRIIRELGAGSTAHVYLAEDQRLQRQVAIKVLRPALAGMIHRARFDAEILVAAGLAHPHVVPLLDAGEASGALYYVMPHVAGQTLRERLTLTPQLPVDEAVSIARDVADALSYAHRRGFVHRDIKPENILLADGHALVTDFGIARALEGGPFVTEARWILGTPAYLSPERTITESPEDGRGDLYSLGCVVYEALTGRPPFIAGTVPELLDQHRARPPAPIGEFRPDVPPGLARLIADALAKRPEDRPESAAAMRHALEQIQRGNAATPAPRLRWGLGIAAVALGTILIPRLTRGPGLTGIVTRAPLTIAREWETYPSISSDGRTVAYQVRGDGLPRVELRDIAGGPPRPVPKEVGGFQRFPALSPDGTRILVLTDRGLTLIDPKGSPPRVLAHEGWTPAWSPDGRWVVYGSDTALFVGSVDSGGGKVIYRGNKPGTPAVSPDGRRIAFATGSSGFHWEGNLSPGALWSIAPDGSDLRQLTAGGFNTSPIWLRDGRALLFISDRDGGRDIYQLDLDRSGGPRGPPRRFTTGMNAERIALSGDGTRLVWSVTTESSNIWAVPLSAEEPAPISHARPLTQGTRVIEGFDLSPDGEWLYFDSDHKGISHIFKRRVAGGEEIQLTDGPAPDFGPAVSPDGREIAFHSPRNGNRDIFVIPAAGGSPVQVSTSPQEDWNVHWGPTGRALVWDEAFNQDSTLWTTTGRADGTWEAPRAILTGPHGLVFAPRWSPNGRWITFSGDRGLQVLELASGKVHVAVPPPPPVEAEFGVWAPDSRSIYYQMAAPDTGFVIGEVPVLGGRRRTVVYADDPPNQGHRFGLRVHRGVVYFGLTTRSADIWSGGLTRR
jgi:serine/threonine-protein kinase